MGTETLDLREFTQPSDAVRTWLNPDRIVAIDASIHPKGCHVIIRLEGGFSRDRVFPSE